METCPECGFDSRRMSPQDAAVAARSFPRRFRSMIVRRDDEENTDALVRRRPGPSQRSALELVADAAAAMAARAEDVRRIAVVDGAEVGAPVPPAEPGTVDDTLDRLDAAAIRLAEAIEKAKSTGSDWRRTGVGPVGEVSLLDAAAAGVHEGVHRLRGIEQVLQAVRGRPAT